MLLRTDALCLVLTRKRMQFVCLRDGCKLPGQIVTTVRQDTPQAQAGTCTAECEAWFWPEAYTFKDGRLCVFGTPLYGVESAIVVPQAPEEHYERLRLKMTAVISDTKLEPYNHQTLQK